MYNLKYLVLELVPVASSLPDGTSKSSQNGVHQKTLNFVLDADIPMGKVCVHAEYTRLQDKILLLCDDESVMLFNVEQVRLVLSRLFFN